MGSALSGVLGNGGLAEGILGGPNSNGLLGMAGGIAGSMFGGPIGGMVGSALGNMVQDMVADSTQQAAQKLHQEDGMPKFLVDDIQQTVRDAVDDLKSHDVDEDIQRGCEDAHGEKFDMFSRELSESIVNNVRAELHGGDCEALTGHRNAWREAGAGVSSGSWMQAIAEAMGKVMGEKASDLVSLSKQISNHAANNGSTAGGSDGTDEAGAAQAAADTQTLNAKFQATSQEFSLLQNTFSTAMKTIGENMASLARKQ